MPIYEYLCSQCHQLSDSLQKVNDPAPEVCPHCGAKDSLARQVSRTSFVLKGGGWYADLYSSSKDKKPDGGKPDTAAKADGGGTTASTSTTGASTSGGSSSSESGSSGSSSSSGAPSTPAATPGSKT